MMTETDIMTTMNRLLFDTLAKGSAVYVQGIGTFAVKTITLNNAKDGITAKKIITLHSDKCGADIRELFTAQAAVPCENIDEIFALWLLDSKIASEGATATEEYNFDKVLRIKKDTAKGVVTITPVAALAKILNPLQAKETGAPQSAVPKKKKSTLFAPILWGVAGGVVLIGVLWFFGIVEFRSQIEFPATETVPAAVVVPAEEIPEPVVPADSVAAAAVTTPAAATTAQPESTTMSLEAPKGRYYLIRGAFSSEENALAEVFALRNKGYKPHILPSKNKRLIMVSVMDFATQEEAKQQLPKQNPDWNCWIYYNE